jgi:tight adherence protein C
MSEWLPWSFTCAAGISGLALALLLVRMTSQGLAGARSSSDPDLPWVLRWAWQASAALLPLVRRFPTRLRRAAGRAMAAEDWAASVTGDRWLAIRSCHSAALALVSAVAAQTVGLPIAGAMALAATGAFMITGQWMRRRRAERERVIARELPPYLDLLTVSIEAGSSLTAAMRLIAASAPAGALRNYFERVLRQIRAGRLRAEAFASVADDLDSPPLRTLATALAHGEASGMSLGAVLRAQAAQRTAERFARAEKLAMEAPVKLLGPLILCIFPCTFIVLAVPIVVRLREALGP